jgi:hypothetical protein
MRRASKTDECVIEGMEKNDQLLKQIADVTTKRGLYREMRNQITTALSTSPATDSPWSGAK